MPNLANLRGAIIDMDGVLWRGRQTLAGVPEFFDVLNQRGIAFVLATNNATATREQFLERLLAANVPASLEDILTSAIATSVYLKETLPNGASLLVIGEDGVRRAVSAQGFALTDTAEEAEAVVVGMDRNVCWPQMAEATLAIRRGLPFVGTNPDLSFPTERGQVPGNGATLAALQAASGVEPIVMGKPEPHLYRQAMQILGTEPDQTLIVGDRLETDILGGIRLGAPTVLLLTGVTERSQAESSSIRADWIVPDLTTLSQMLSSQ
ncbi:MAG: HAD-IIA family hydrolase [Anaerolineales bacterium]